MNLKLEKLYSEVWMEFNVTDAFDTRYKHLTFDSTIWVKIKNY